MTITVKSTNGRIWTFDSLEDAVVKMNREFPIANLKYGSLRWYSKTYDFHFGCGDYVVYRDEIGIIPVWRIKEAFYNLPLEVREPTYWYWRWRKAHAKPEHFRKYPVPHTGSRRYGHDRRIRTLNELKAECAFELDEDVVDYKIKRRARYIPDDREDYVTYVPRCHNWKKFRRHQWKG
jgi:hypothetical protein